MFYCLTDNLEFEISFMCMWLNRRHFGVRTRHHIVLKHSTCDSARLPPTVAVILRKPSSATSHFAKIGLKYFALFERRVPTYIQFEVSTTKMNTSGMNT